MSKEKMILWIAGMLLERLDSEEVKVWADKGLDMLEDKIAASPNKYDDQLALPLINVARVAFSIPDND